MNENTWILGATDPEMAAIETLLREAGQSVVYALSPAGARVSPRDAYAADAQAMPEGRLVLVECGPAEQLPVGRFLIARCDHHNPGDMGYGAPPAEFWSASSLGQVVAILARGSLLPDEWERVLSDRTGYSPAHLGWVVGQGAEWLLVPRTLLFTAAADHCLAAAYAGQCPEVDPEELFLVRATARGEWLARSPGEGRDEARREIARAYYGRTPEDLDLGEVGERWTSAVRHATEQTRALLRSGEIPTADLGSLPVGCDYHGPANADPVSCRDCGLSPELRVLDLRAIGTLPELPTALSLEGLCALYRMPPPAGRPGPTKIGIIGAGLGTAPGPEPVEAFLAAAREGCVAGTHVVTGPPGTPDAPYGDSARGFAGAHERGAP